MNIERSYTLILCSSSIVVYLFLCLSFDVGRQISETAVVNVHLHYHLMEMLLLLALN